MKQLIKISNKRKNFSLSANIIKVITIVVLISLLEFLSRIGWLSPYKMPSPTKILIALWEVIMVGFPRGVTILLHLKATVLRILQGYVLAVVIGIPAGLIIGKSFVLDRIATPVITFARSVAAISLLPLFIAWFGITEISRILLISYGCFWVILTNTIQGVKQIDVNYINAGKMLGANNKQLFFRVMLPATLPRIFIGLRVAVGVAFMVIVAVEMIGTVVGLGALIQQARFYYNIGITIAGMILIGIFGLILSVVLERLERIILPWAFGLEEVER